MSGLLTGSRETGVTAPGDIGAAAARLGVSSRTVHDRLSEAVRSIGPAQLDEAAQQAAANASSAVEAVEMLRGLGFEGHAAALIAGIARTPARHAARRWSAPLPQARPPPGAA